MTVRLHIMRLCTPSIWPALARANKYSKARNREARRDEARRGEVSRVESNPVPPFPALWRAISKSYSQFLSGTAYRDVLTSIIVRAVLPRINSRRRNREQSGAAGTMRPISSGHTSRATTRLHRASDRASEQVRRPTARVSAFVWIAWEIIISISECAVYVRYRRFLSLRVFHCFLQCVGNNERACPLIIKNCKYQKINSDSNKIILNLWWTGRLKDRKYYLRLL